MSVAFYNANGTMLGTDPHEYFTGVPELPPIPVTTAHFVCAGFDEHCADDATRLKKVTADGHPMIQVDFKVDRVLPHAPLTVLPPYPGVELGNLLLIIGFSGTSAVMAVASVTGCGKPLATCLYSCLGSNLNCGDPIDLPLDVVVNECSVLTQPTGADYASAVFAFAMNGLAGKLVGKVGNKLFGNAFKNYTENVWRRVVLPFRKKGEEVAKDFLNEIVKDLNDYLKGTPRARVKDTLGALGVTHLEGMP